MVSLLCWCVYLFVSVCLGCGLCVVVCLLLFCLYCLLLCVFSKWVDAVWFVGLFLLLFRLCVIVVLLEFCFCVRCCLSLYVYDVCVAVVFPGLRCVCWCFCVLLFVSALLCSCVCVLFLFVRLFEYGCCCVCVLRMG